MTESLTTSALKFDRSYAAERLRRSRHPLRRLINSFYLRNVLADVRGATIDFGYGGCRLAPWASKWTRT